MNLYFLDYGLEITVQIVAQGGPLSFLLSKRGGLIQFFCSPHLDFTLPDYPLPLGLMVVCKTVLAYSVCEIELIALTQIAHLYEC
jgi:hypothetical protein